MNPTDKFHVHLQLAQGIARLDLNNRLDLLEFKILLEQKQGVITYINNFFIQHMLKWLTSRITYLVKREQQLTSQPNSFKSSFLDNSDIDSEPDNSKEGIRSKLD